ncbi:MAG: bifunctional diaminohydroxyphosphoribosylaminopyrimidine deaminase/5-amino-6-(5-phosphoribosylamino)uracil reductase RibD [Deltaproteobacteria bacterium]|nr:bifunctional diaminohydroxyphosphoribosylaminopyrimidine deaminase/5-amino-6-(5-phosphoribosylamino)uracil reductase RibD [Deltaproteobacteria bacterium]
MDIAVNLAKKGIGKTSPNPAVGAVVVKNNRIIGKGCHKKAGLPHGEIIALNNSGTRAKGADLYVTLEPCDHYGRTPPCTEAVIRSGIKRVFIGMKDPNPIVSGRGIRKLKKNNIEVKTGILEHECKEINEPYIKYITTKKPFVTLKLASTLDGKIAASSGESKWITSEKSREYVHKLRSNADAVMVGIGTVLKDNPFLTVRLKTKRPAAIGPRQPVRIVVDSKLKIPLDANVFDAKAAKLIIAATKNATPKKIKQVRERGAEVVLVDSKDGHVDLKKLMHELGKREITSILIEGGARLAASAIKDGIADKVLIFYAPLLLGGNGIQMISSLGIKRLKDAVHLKNIQVKRIGKDVLLEGIL